MKNFKKALALVLAAATVFTFAPVSSFAAAGDITDDGLTTTKGIDSNPAGVTLSKSTSSYSSAIWLKEHDDKSSTPSVQQVKAYRITVERKWDKDAKKYVDAVDLLTSSTSTTVQTPSSTFTPSASVGAVINQTVSDSAVATYDKLTANDSDDQLATRTYLVVNTDTAKTADGKINDKNGAYIAFKSTGNADGVFKVTVSALGAFSDSAEALDTSEFNITIPSGDEVFNLKKTSVSAAEGDTVKVPYTIDNYNGKIAKLEVESDNTDVATVKNLMYRNSTSNKATDYPVTKDVDSLEIVAHEAGSASITVHPLKSDNTEYSAEQTIEVTVTPKNAKLYVSFNGDDGYYDTYTDDIAYTPSTDGKTYYINSGTDTVDAQGTLSHGSSLTLDQNGDPYTGATNQYRVSYGPTPDLTGKNATDVENYEYSTDYNFTRPAAPLNADGNKTVKITASSDAGADISYSLVAFDHYQDIDTTGTQDANNKYTGTKNGVIVNKVYLPTSKSYASVASAMGQSTRVVYTEAKAKKLGAIDNDGLVTLKNGDDGDVVYAVVTAKKKDVTTSVIIVPISLHQQSPVALYVASQNYFVQKETGTYGADYENRADYAIYLNLKDHATDKLNIWTNAGDAYYTGSSSNDDIVTYKNGTITAKKAGTAYVTIKTSSAPNVAGIETAKIKVVVNDKAANNETLGYQSVSVTKDNPTAKIAATSTAKGATIIFDKTLYKIDTSRTAPRLQYRPVNKDDTEFGSVLISSTGTVTYQKNAGTVYVRAYAAATDKTNPSTWTYIPVNYGQKVVDTQLNVDTTPIVLDVKGTKQINASVSTTGAAITYTSADPTIASVDANGLVTANKSGVTSIKVATTSDGKEGSSANIAVVVRGNATVEDAVKTPSKVTGVKVTNLKGGKVKVTWTKQNQKNIKYYVKKTVGKKSAGKSVGSNKTTLSVKKGATVKVKVKAYIYDATGKKLVGSYSKTITKKTDKK